MGRQELGGARRECPRHARHSILRRRHWAVRDDTPPRKENDDLCGVGAGVGKENPELCEVGAGVGKENPELCGLDSSDGKDFAELCETRPSTGKDFAEL